MLEAHPELLALTLFVSTGMLDFRQVFRAMGHGSCFLCQWCLPVFRGRFMFCNNVFFDNAVLNIHPSGQAIGASRISHGTRQHHSLYFISRRQSQDPVDLLFLHLLA